TRLQGDWSSDVCSSDLVMQWLPDHPAIMQRLLAALPEGGVLAIQMPDNTREPGLVFQGEVGESGPWRDHPEIKAASREDLPSPRSEEHTSELQSPCNLV